MKQIDIDTINSIVREVTENNNPKVFVSGMGMQGKNLVYTLSPTISLPSNPSETEKLNSIREVVSDIVVGIQAYFGKYGYSFEAWRCGLCILIGEKEMGV